MWKGQERGKGKYQRGVGYGKGERNDWPRPSGPAGSLLDTLELQEGCLCVVDLPPYNSAGGGAEQY